MPFYLSLIVPPCVLLMASLGTGYAALYPLQKRGLAVNALVFLILAYFLGQGILSCLFLLLGLAGQFRAVVLAPIVGLAILAGCRALYVTAAPALAALKREHAQLLRASRWWYALLPVCFGFLGYGLMGLAATFDGDSIAFYYVTAKLMSATNVLQIVPGYDTFSSITLNGDTLTAFLMKLKMPELSMRLYPWLNCFFILPMAYTVAVQYGRERRFALLFLVFICSSTAFVYLQIYGKMDLLSVGQGLAALCCLYYALFTAAHRGAFLFLAGLTAGFAVDFKMSYALILVPWGFALIVGSSLREWASTENRAISWPRVWGMLTRSLLYVAAGMTLALLPHLLKNYVFYDMVTLSLRGVPLSSFSEATVQRLLLSYPLALVYGNYWVQTGHLSSLLLGCLPFMFLVSRRFWKEQRPLLLLWGGSLCGLLAWLVLLPSVFQLRYMLLCLLFLGIPWLAATARYSRVSKLAAVAVPVLAACAILVAYNLAKDNTFIKPRATREYLKNKRPEALCDIFPQFSTGQAAVNAIAPKDARVYVNYYRYWLRPDLLRQAVPRRRTKNAGMEEELAVAPDSTRFWELMKETNTTYIQYDYTSSAYLDPMLAEPPPWVTIREIFAPENSSFKMLQVIYN